MVTISVSEKFAERFRAVANQGIDPEELLLELLAEREAEDAALLAMPLSVDDIDAAQEALSAEEGIPWEEYITRQRAIRAARRKAGCR